MALFYKQFFTDSNIKDSKINSNFVGHCGKQGTNFQTLDLNRVFFWKKSQVMLCKSLLNNTKCVYLQGQNNSNIATRSK